MNVKKYPLVAIVVAVHNNKQDTVAFLECIKQVSYPNHKTIIIDDGSTDGTSEMIEREHPGVILLKGDGSLWWAHATNIGMEKAIKIGAEYVLWMNNDVAIDTKFISALVSTADRNPHSITIPKVYFYDEPKRIQQAGWELNWVKGGFQRTGNGEIDTGQYDKERDVPCGSIGVLINTMFLTDIGPLYFRNFPQYRADIDFTYRAYKKGYRIIYQPKAVMWHKEQSTVKKNIPITTSRLSTLIYLTTGVQSRENVGQAVNFYLRHCPVYMMPFMVLQYIWRLLHLLWAIMKRQQA